MLNIVVNGQRRDVEEMLRGCGMQTRLVDTSALAVLARPSAPQPDAIVVDLRDQSRVPPAVGDIKRQHQTTGIVIIASALDPALLVEAMRAGVTEVVSEPLTANDLEQAIVRISQQRPGSESGQLFGFVGAKGGVGTTTVAVNVAIALGALGKGARTLLIDAHQAGGDAAVFTNIEPKFTLANAIENTHRLDRVMLRSLVTEIAPFVDLLASPERTVALHADTTKLRAILDFATSNYRYVVVDLPRSDGIVLDALDSVAALVIVANQELATVKNASRMAAMLRQRYGRSKVSVVLSRSDRRAEIGHEDVERAVGCEVAQTFPSDYRLAVDAMNKGRPIALDNHNELSAAFVRFARTLAGVRVERPKPVRAGLFAKFTPRRSEM